VGRVRDVAVCEFIYFVLQSIDSQVRNCLKYGLACRDPPAINSLFLRGVLGLTEFRVKRFWRVVDALGNTKLTIYRVKNVEFDIQLVKERGPAYVINDVLFADIFDCETRRNTCREIANTNSLYLYISGYVGGSHIKVNSVYVLKKIAEFYPDCYVSLIELAHALALSKDLRKVIKGITCLFKILRGSKLLNEILPLIPRNINELLVISPILGKLANALTLKIPTP